MNSILSFLIALASMIIICHSTRPKLALCLVTRDENIDLLEWVEYHYSIGVTNVIIMDNNSTVPVITKISKYISSGFVYHYVYFKTKMDPTNQIYAYDFCLNNFRSEFSHIGFIDTDEFIVIKNHSATIIDVLEPYQHYGGLALNWILFGSSSHRKRPPGGILSNYYKCAKNSHIKTIVNTANTIQTLNPHFFLHKEGKFAVDTAFQRVDGPWNKEVNVLPPDHLYEIAYINHYVVKSYADFKRKISRGSAQGIKKPLWFFNYIDINMTDNCNYLSPRKIH